MSSSGGLPPLSGRPSSRGSDGSGGEEPLGIGPAQLSSTSAYAAASSMSSLDASLLDEVARGALRTRDGSRGGDRQGRVRAWKSPFALRKEALRPTTPAIRDPEEYGTPDVSVDGAGFRVPEHLLEMLSQLEDLMVDGPEGASRTNQPPCLGAARTLSP